VLDLGCGQGRDSIFLGRLEYQVTGIDISEVGISQMSDIAKKEKLPLKGLVADIYSYTITDEYDIILLDSMLHFYKNDVERETKLFVRIVKELKISGVICNFMLKSNKNEKYLKKIIKDSGIKFEVICDDYTEYPEGNFKYHMYVIRKLTM